MKTLLILALALVGATASILPEYHRELLVPTLDGRITNGKDAAEGQFPYQVGLSLRINALQSAWCGGSLIGSNWVLTAAHCVDGVSSVTVYLGSTTRTSGQSSTVSASDIIIHANWNSNTIKNDIAVIRIPAVSFTSKIQKIALPKLASSYSNYAGTVAIASGWGKTSDSSSVATKLQYADLSIITNTKCASTYGTIVTGGNICASTENKISTCNGDSGGPLVSKNDDVQIGLTSFGSSAGCEKGYPVAFTRTTYFLDWIKTNTGISY